MGRELDKSNSKIFFTRVGMKIELILTLLGIFILAGLFILFIFYDAISKKKKTAKKIKKILKKIDNKTNV